MHLSNVHFVLRIVALLDPSWGSGLPTFIHLVRSNREGRGGKGMEGRRETVKAKILAEKCAFVPS